MSAHHRARRLGRRPFDARWGRPYAGRRAPRRHRWSPVSDPSPGWTFRPVRRRPVRSSTWSEAGTLDAGLAATLWRLAEGPVPLVVVATVTLPSGRRCWRRSSIRCSAELRRAELRGDEETFDWLPQATELGWSGARDRPTEPSSDPTTRSSSRPSCRTACRSFTWGERRADRGARHGDRLRPGDDDDGRLARGRPRRARPPAREPDRRRAVASSAASWSCAASTGSVTGSSPRTISARRSATRTATPSDSDRPCWRRGTRARPLRGFRVGDHARARVPPRRPGRRSRARSRSSARAA